MGLRYFDARVRAWDLINQVPTATVQDSKVFGVYVANLDFYPAKATFDGEQYVIDEVWIEHRTEPSRGLFTTRRNILPELVLCLKVRSADGKMHALANDLRIKIKAANTRNILFAGANDVLFDEIGKSIPKTVVLVSSTTQKEFVVELKAKEISAEWK